MRHLTNSRYFIIFHSEKNRNPLHLRRCPLDIKFEFEGKKYIAGSDFYDKDKVVLPDRTVLKVGNGWSETAPPKPKELVKSGVVHTGTIEEIAQMENAAIARIDDSNDATAVASDAATFDISSVVGKSLPVIRIPIGSNPELEAVFAGLIPAEGQPATEIARIILPDGRELFAMDSRHPAVDVLKRLHGLE
jgi:hypothetical protein